MVARKKQKLALTNRKKGVAMFPLDDSWHSQEEIEEAYHQGHDATVEWMENADLVDIFLEGIPASIADIFPAVGELEQASESGRKAALRGE